MATLVIGVESNGQVSYIEKSVPGQTASPHTKWVAQLIKMYGQDANTIFDRFWVMARNNPDISLEAFMARIDVYPWSSCFVFLFKDGAWYYYPTGDKYIKYMYLSNKDIKELLHTTGCELVFPVTELKAGDYLLKSEKTAYHPILYKVLETSPLSKGDRLSTIDVVIQKVSKQLLVTADNFYITYSNGYNDITRAYRVVVDKRGYLETNTDNSDLVYYVYRTGE